MIVILEDSPARIDWFKQTFLLEEFVHTFSVTEFIEMVEAAEQAGNLKLVIMDHDLGGRCPGTARFDCDDQGLTGADAADRLTTTAPVLIWSVNPHGSKTIELILRNKGIQTARLPFLGMNFTSIISTIERVLKNGQDSTHSRRPTKV